MRSGEGQDHWRKVERLKRFSAGNIICVAIEISKIYGRNSVGENDC